MLVLPMPTTTSSYSVLPIDAELSKSRSDNDWWSLLEASLWLAAVNQLLYATTLGFGALPALCGRALHKADAVKLVFNSISNIINTSSFIKNLGLFPEPQ